MKTIVIGIGNPFLADDRAGIVVVESLAQEKLKADFEILYTVGFELLDKILGYDQAIIVDACMLGGKLGEIFEVGLDDIFQTKSMLNSHAIHIGTSLRLGMDLYPELMPKQLKIFLIEVKNITEFSNQFTPQVKAAVEKVKTRIKKLL